MDIIRIRFLVLLLAALTLCSAADWRSSFPVDRKNLGSSGSNPYFILESGYQLHYRRGTETLTVTVTTETKLIDGVQTRVILSREEKNGQPVEITRDYYAVDRTTGDVYYFGEDVDVYKGGKISGHEGAWLSGVNGARFGLMMPGRITLGDRFCQELAPKQAMDRAEVVAIAEPVVTPAGTYANCVHFKETSAIESGPGDHKWYAPGIGLVKDNRLVLAKIERIRQ